MRRITLTVIGVLLLQGSLLFLWAYDVAGMIQRNEVESYIMTLDVLGEFDQCDADPTTWMAPAHAHHPTYVLGDDGRPLAESAPKLFVPGTPDRTKTGYSDASADG